MGLLVFLVLMTSDLIDSLADVSFGNVKARFRKVEKQQERQASDIRSLQVAFNGIVTKYEYDKLVGLSKDRPFMCYYSDDLISELKRLRSMTFIDNREGVGIRSIVKEFKHRGEKFDLKKFFFITDAGKEYTRLREEMDNQGGDEVENQDR